jgi:peptidyl-prolyl cis-trans isomerase D
MAVLEKIRVKMGIFISVLIGVALLSFVIDANTFRSAISMFSSKYDVGEMNGKGISYQDFQKKVDYYTKLHQMMTNSSSLDEQATEMVYQSAWQEFLNDEVMIPHLKSAGIDVGDDEMYDLTQGAQISPVLQREQTFLGEDGSFDKNRVTELIKAMAQDNSGNLSLYWSFLEKNIKNDQMYSKYISMLSKSNILNQVQMRRMIEDNNITSDVSFVMQPYGLLNDSTVSVSQSEIKKYYNVHKNDFEQNASRDIEYVVFTVEPSVKDISLTREDIDKLIPEFATTTNLKNFLLKNSDKALDQLYYKQGELKAVSPVLDSFAFAAKSTDVLPVYLDGNIFRSARIADIKMLPDSVNVQHILLRGASEDTLSKLADSLITVIGKGGNFNELASKYSADRNPKAVPGELGWMTQTMKVPGFDTCFVVPVGKVFKMKSVYGLHIVNVKERTAPVKKVQLAVLTKEAIAGKETYQTIYSKANEFASKAQGGYENFTKTAKELNQVPIPATGIPEGAKTVATYKNAREISRWVYEAKKGDVSQIISLDNKYFFIAALTGIKEEGIPPVEEVSAQISSILKRDKAIEKLAASVKEELKGIKTLDEAASKMGQAVNKQTGISFGSIGTQSFDPKFIGSVAGAKENILTGPIAGSVGIYVFNVDARQTGSFFTEADAKQRLMQYFSYQIQQVPLIIEKEASVKDRRAKFF